MSTFDSKKTVLRPRPALVIDGSRAIRDGGNRLPSLPETDITGEKDYIKELLTQRARYDVEMFDTEPRTVRKRLLDRIRRFLQAAQIDGALIWYFGAGEPSTGNWCLPNGSTISFDDIFDVFCRSSFRRKGLTIVTDCSSSGQWVRDCGTALDAKGIAACGHHARKTGIQITVASSCLAHERPRKHYFVENCVSVNDTELDFSTPSDGNQTSVFYSFGKVRCRYDSPDKCDITGKWMQQSLVSVEDPYRYKTCFDTYRQQEFLKKLKRMDNGEADANEIYQEALRKGSAITPRLTINLMGPDGVGKTCLRRHLLGLPFEQQPSTRGIETKLAMTSAKGWKEMSEEDHEDIVSDTIARNIFRLGHQEKSTLDVIQHAQGAEANVSSFLSTANQKSEIEEDKDNPERKTEDISIAKSKFNDLTPEMSQRLVTTLKKPQDDTVVFPVSRKTEELVVNIRDQAGQGRYLMTHSSVSASRSRFKSTINILVFNVCKPLDEETVSVFRWNPDDEGEKQETHGVMVTTFKNFEHWITSEMIAEEEHDAISDHLGKELEHDRNLQYPVFLFLATHGGEKDATPEVLKRQNSLLKKLIRKCKIQSHIIRLGSLGLETGSLSPELQDNRVFCLVDNTLSGPSSQDTTVKDIRKKGKEMAVSYWSNQPALPLPWLTLMRSLAVFKEKSGRAIATLSQIYQLATGDCHIPEHAVPTAIAYLSSFHAVLYFPDAPQLRDKVFTDPQWLFDAMALFITPPSPVKFADRHFDEAWQNVYDTGYMEWRLADHLLKEKADITENDTSVILEVLQLFDVICSDESLVVKPGMRFFVPCLLTHCETQLDQLVPASPNLSSPPSLLYCPVNVAVVPESLFFRLVSRCVKKFGNNYNSPTLKRNQCQFYLKDKLKLKIRYEQEGCLIAITLVSVAQDEQLRKEAYAKHCSEIRQFVHDQLEEVKCRGMKGLTLQLRVQYSDTETLDVLSNDNMISLRGYPPQDRQCLVTKSGKDVDDSVLVGLRYWYADKLVDEVDDRRDKTWPSLDDKETFKNVSICIAYASSGKWRKFGQCLGMQREVNDSKLTGMNDFEKVMDLLFQWKDDKGAEATAMKLKKACSNAGILGRVEELMKEEGLID